MKIGILGSRTINSYELVCETVTLSGYEKLITEVVSGMAPGVDRLGVKRAKEHGVLLTPFYANWTRFGKSAGPIRNREMAVYVDGAIILWDGSSPGTRNMIEICDELSIPKYVRDLSKENFPITDEILNF